MFSRTRHFLDKNEITLCHILEAVSTSSLLLKVSRYEKAMIFATNVHGQTRKTKKR
jgi:hypothetical protein